MMTLEHLIDAFKNAIEDGYTIAASGNEKSCHVTLEKGTYYGTHVRTSQDGETIEEAFRKCIENFPRSPLDGTNWKNKRIEASINAGNSEARDTDEIPF